MMVSIVFGSLSRQVWPLLIYSLLYFAFCFSKLHLIYKVQFFSVCQSVLTPLKLPGVQTSNMTRLATFLR